MYFLEIIEFNFKNNKNLANKEKKIWKMKKN